jgi:hypothetical protein
VFLLSFALSVNVVFGFDDITMSSTSNFFPWWITQTPEIVKENSENKNEQQTKPTFGLDHQNNQKIIESGFKINNQTFAINDNFHTPFKEQVVKIGETNTFEAKLFASEGLRVQEFLFGIPEIGHAHYAELGVEIWFNYDGTIKKIKAVQESNIIDESTFDATHR